MSREIDDPVVAAEFPEFAPKMILLALGDQVGSI